MGYAGPVSQVVRHIEDSRRIHGRRCTERDRNHGTHAEAIESHFDPRRVGYRDLLKRFFQIHDPTTVNRQGSDIGTSYRSEIFYVSEAQRGEAIQTIEDVSASGLWLGRVVTKLSLAREFWDAEPEHQNCLERHLHDYTASSRN